MKTIGKRDYRQEITDAVIKMIEAGDLVKWVKPWVDYGMPRNFSSKRVYEGGLNQLILGMRMAEEGWNYPLFASFLQIKELGGKVKPGSSGTPILFFGKGVIEDEETGEEKDIRISRFYSVFNIRQTDLDPIKYLDLIAEHHDMTTPEVEDFFSKVPIEVNYGGDKAAYSPPMDVVLMPLKEQFTDLKDFYSVLGHEFIHATGHESRLNRLLSTEFGSEEYAFEELIAELGSMMLCVHTGIEPRLNHGTADIDHWLKRLKSDTHAIFKASYSASSAVNWLIDSLK